MAKRKLLVLLLFLTNFLSVSSAGTEELVALKRSAAEHKTAEAYMAVVNYYFKNQLDKDSVLQTYMDSAYHAATAEKSDKHLGDYYYRKAWLYNNADSMLTLHRYLKEALGYYDKVGLTHRHAQSYAKLGVSFFNLCRVDSAMHYLKKAIDDKYAATSDAPFDEVCKNCYHFLMESYRSLAEYDSAMFYNYKMIELVAVKQDSLALAQCHIFMGTICNDSGRHPEALEWFHSAAKLYEYAGDYNMTANSYLHAAGELCVYLGRYEDAMEMAGNGVVYAQYANNQSLEASCLALVATCFHNLGAYDVAIKYYRQALDIYTELGEEKLRYNTELQMMSSFQGKGQADSARIYMRKTELSGDPGLPIDTTGYPWGEQYDKIKAVSSDATVIMRSIKYDILNQEFEEREAITLRQRIWLISGLSVLIVLVLLLLYNRQRQKTKAEKAARYAEEKENEYLILQQETEMRLIRKYIEGLETERTRLSRELHDGVCNDLLAMEMQMKVISSDKAELEKHLELLSRTRENIRNISHDLMPPAFQYADIDEVLADYVLHADHPQHAEIKYISEEGIDWTDIDPELAGEMYRITQEALGNSIKHSQATRVFVALTRNEDTIEIEIRDNGKGFDKSRTNRGIGMRTMYERVKSIGGELSIDTGSSGTTVVAKFKI